MVVVCPYCRTKIETDPGVLWVQCSECHERINLTSLGTTPGSPEVQVEQDLAGKEFGKYRLEELIGIGGMGVVYRATDDEGKTVAVKILYYSTGENESIKKRFERETEILGGLYHRGIVRLLGSGRHDGYLYIVMEYIPLSLAQRLRQSPLSRDEIRTVMVDVADALSYAHDKKIVHRDLKPTNILLARDGAKISDFGIAHVEYDKDATSLTQTAAILGTFNYMSPEQRMGEKDIDKRSDIYSLGVLLYELLTGRVPIGSFPAASSVRKDIRPRVDGVVARALSQERSGRYEDVKQFKEDLRKALSGRERRTLFIATVAAIFVFLAFALYMLYMSGTFSGRQPRDNPAGSTPPAAKKVDDPGATAAAAAPGATEKSEPGPEGELVIEEPAGKRSEATAAGPAGTGERKKASPAGKGKVEEGKKDGEGMGTLVLLSTPWASVIIDGKDTKRKTPVTTKNPLELASGTHEVTFVLPDGDSYSYQVNIKARKETRLIKNFNKVSPAPKKKVEPAAPLEPKVKSKKSKPKAKDLPFVP